MAYEFYVTIEGSKQKFKGESPKKEQADKIPGLSFQYEVVAPLDAATGQHSGKRQHKPIVFVKEWGVATPQLFGALVNNEVLKKVTFEFVQIDKGTGKEVVYFTIVLTNASVAAIKQYSDPGVEGSASAKHTSQGGLKELEAISLTFQKIELEHKTGKTMAMDDWHQS